MIRNRQSHWWFFILLPKKRNNRVGRECEALIRPLRGFVSNQ